MSGNAATSIRYKQVFNRDLLVSFAGMNEGGYDLDMLKELAFVMAKQADSANFMSLTDEDYITWLEQFEEVDLIGAMQDIVALWLDNTKNAVTSKKKSSN